MYIKNGLLLIFGSYGEADKVLFCNYNPMMSRDFERVCYTFMSTYDDEKDCRHERYQQGYSL